MPTYFKPLRRKFGVVTLVLGCFLGSCWIRGQLVTDDLRVYSATTINCLLSGNQGIFCHRTVFGDALFDEQAPQGREWIWNRLPIGHADAEIAEFKLKMKPQWNFVIAFVGCTKSELGNVDQQAFFAPYWSITIPLTLLSSWLLLSKPRAGKLSTESPPKTES